MGCGSSTEKAASLDAATDASGAYNLAEADKITIDGKEQLKGMGGGIMQEGQREAILEQIFEAVDDVCTRGPLLKACRSQQPKLSVLMQSCVRD